MKPLIRKDQVKIIFMLLFSVLCLRSPAQDYCTYEIGDYVLLKSVADFRQFPNANSEIIYTFQVDNNVSFVVVDSNYDNGYIKVKLEVDKQEKDKSIIKLSDRVGWILFTSVKANQTIYSSGNFSVENYDSWIKELLDYKLSNSCLYSEFSLAFCYQQRGIAKFKNSDFFGAVQDLTSSIKMKTEVCLSYSFYYRAKAKQDLLDYSGALSDWDMTLKQCALSKNNYNCACLQCDHKIFISIPHSFCIEDVYVHRASCKSMLKNNNGALADLNTVIALSPEFGPAYYIRGQIKCNMNDKIGGCADLSKAGELGVKNAYEQIQIRCNK